MANYKYILFDMDNTLLDFSRAEYLAFRETAENVGLTSVKSFMKITPR